MRDILLTAFVFGLIPVILARPHVGVLAWAWIGYMNPHRFTWGFGYEFPYAQVIALVTIAAFCFNSRRRWFPNTKLVWIWIAFVVWLNITTMFALVPEDAFASWDKTMKIQLISLLTVLLIYEKRSLNALVWVVVISLGFYGLKGGLFSILGGAENLVFGPPNSFIADNNALGLALIMTLPLMRYLQLIARNQWVRWALTAAMAASALTVLATYSRGAFLGLIAMATVFVVRSRRKGWLMLAVPILALTLLNFMPQQWHDRMNTISEFEEDGSAMGRINAWWFAYRLALDRPILGGGFEPWTPELFSKYAPDPLDLHDSHSIYFEVLAEQGFVGLALFLFLGISLLTAAGRIARLARKNGDRKLLWVADLASMVQVSAIGYAASGAFLGMAYFDLYYHLIAIVVILERYLLEHKRQTLMEPTTKILELPSAQIPAATRQLH